MNSRSSASVRLRNEDVSGELSPGHRALVEGVLAQKKRALAKTLKLGLRLSK